MKQAGWWLGMGVCILAGDALGAMKTPVNLRGQAPPEIRPATGDALRGAFFKQIALRNQNPGAETPGTAQRGPHVVAYCVLPGAQSRFVITSEAQLIQITQAGEATVIGVITAPVSKEYLCMIRTEKTLIGINTAGHLVNTENGAVVGAVVPVEQKPREEPADKPADKPLEEGR